MIETLYCTRDAAAWSAALPIQESVFGSVEFARIVQQHLRHQAHLYVLQDRNGLIAYPYFIRPVCSLPFHEEAAGNLSDAFSPEFTGPLARGGGVEFVAGEFAKRLAEFAAQHGVVSEFVRLHPWKAHTAALVADCLHFNREIVYVDLSWTEPQLWQDSFSHACRKNIRRSQRENVRVFEAQSMGDIREFHRLYVQTMEDRNALQEYYFPLDYFAAIFEQLPGNARFALAEYRNQVIAGTLYLHDRDDVYSYLGGADKDFQHVRPTNAIIYDTILWGQHQGRKRLILGGGHLPEDGIFRFKCSFSPKRARFQVYQRVHLHEQFVALCRGWSRWYGQDLQTNSYFPPYRSVPASDSSQDSWQPAPAIAG